MGLPYGESPVRGIAEIRIVEKSIAGKGIGATRVAANCIAKKSGLAGSWAISRIVSGSNFTEHLR